MALTGRTEKESGGSFMVLRSLRNRKDKSETLSATANTNKHEEMSDSDCVYSAPESRKLMTEDEQRKQEEEREIEILKKMFKPLQIRPKKTALRKKEVVDIDSDDSDYVDTGKVKKTVSSKLSKNKNMAQVKKTAAKMIKKKPVKRKARGHWVDPLYGIPAYRTSKEPLHPLAYKCFCAEPEGDYYSSMLPSFPVVIPSKRKMLSDFKKEFPEYYK